jgi:hypothetical protein
VTERGSPADRQQRLGLTIELDGRGVADSKDASKAENEAMLGHEPFNRARAQSRRQQLSACHSAALEAGDLGYPVLH